MIMTDPDIRHFVSTPVIFTSSRKQGFIICIQSLLFFSLFSLQLFLGCYRDNEVTLSHPLTAKLNAIQEQGISIVPIKIGEYSI